MPQRKQIDPKEQFSKWLARSGAVYWIVFHTLLMVLMYLRPEIANACVYLSVIISVVMIIHVWAYTRNSVYEKGLLAMLDKTRMELTLDRKTGKKEEEDKTEYHEEEEEE